MNLEQEIKILKQKLNLRYIHISKKIEEKINKPYKPLTREQREKNFINMLNQHTYNKPPPFIFGTRSQIMSYKLGDNYNRIKSLLTDNELTNNDYELLETIIEKQIDLSTLRTKQDILDCQYTEEEKLKREYEMLLKQCEDLIGE